MQSPTKRSVRQSRSVSCLQTNNSHDQDNKKGNVIKKPGQRQSKQLSRVKSLSDTKEPSATPQQSREKSNSGRLTNDVDADISFKGILHTQFIKYRILVSII